MTKFLNIVLRALITVALSASVAACGQAPSSQFPAPSVSAVVSHGYNVTIMDEE